MDLLELLGLDEPDDNESKIISFNDYKNFKGKDANDLMGQLLERAYNELKDEHQFIMTSLWDEMGVVNTDGEPDMRKLMDYVYALYENYNIDVIKSFYNYLFKNKYLDKPEDRFIYYLYLFNLRILILLAELFISKNITGIFYAKSKLNYIFEDLFEKSYRSDITEFKAAIREYKDNPFYPQRRLTDAVKKLNGSHNERLAKMTDEFNSMKKRLNKAGALSVLNMIICDLHDWKDSYPPTYIEEVQKGHTLDSF